MAHSMQYILGFFFNSLLSRHHLSATQVPWLLTVFRLIILSAILNVTYLTNDIGVTFSWLRKPFCLKKIKLEEKKYISVAILGNSMIMWIE